LDRRLGGPQSRSGRGGFREKFPAPAGNRTPMFKVCLFTPFCPKISNECAFRSGVDNGTDESITISLTIIEASGMIFTVMRHYFVAVCIFITRESVIYRMPRYSG